MSNLDNLTPFTSEQSREEAAKNGKKGGIISGQKRRERKTIKEELLMVLNEKIADKKSGKKTTPLKAISYTLLKQALDGNIKATELLLKIIGEMPKDEMEITQKGINIVAADARLKQAFEDL